MSYSEFPLYQNLPHTMFFCDSLFSVLFQIVWRDQSLLVECVLRRIVQVALYHNHLRPRDQLVGSYNTNSIGSPVFGS